MYDLAVFICRAQPFHYGHASTIQKACSIAKKVLVLIGSSNSARNIRNPFTFEERHTMIRNWADHNNIHHDQLEIDVLFDCVYDDNEWIIQIQNKVKWVCWNYSLKKDNIVLIGHNKDDTTYYLEYFPTFKLHDTGPWPENNTRTVDATKIRELYFEDHIEFYKAVIPQSTLGVLVNIPIDIKKELMLEYAMITAYKKSWAGSPFPPMFVTTDAIVIQNSHILLIKRKNSPGKGNLALPGGFLNQNERILNGCIRELLEETKIHVPEKILRGSITYNQVFDSPNRSSRGRTITHAYLFELEDQKKLARVYGSDDAEKAVWVPLCDLKEMGSEMFEDHWHIAHAMINRATKQYL